MAFREDGMTHLVGQRARLQLHAKLARIAYLDTTERTVRLARRSPFGTWSSSVVVSAQGDPPGLSGVGLGLDLLIDDGDVTRVVYGVWQAVDGSVELSTETAEVAP